MKNFRVIISGGGTGGHIFPAIAIANALKKINQSIEILFIGATGRMEMEKIPQAGFKIEGLPISGLQRKFSLKNLLIPFKTGMSLIKANSIIRKFKPDVVVGVGGYASAPTLFAASLKKIPTLIQEQNSFAGMANKFLAWRAKKICVAYEGMEKFFPKEKIILTGNPVRQDIINIQKSKEQAIEEFGLEKNKKTLLVIGGSLGARTINQSIHLGMEKLSKENIQVIWQTGNNFSVETQNITSLQNQNWLKIFPFIKNMDSAYAVADVVISRAGAIAVSELCIVKKPVILVPSPNVAEDHQTENAMALVKKNAAIFIKDSEAKKKLVNTAIDLIKNENKQKELKNNIRALAITDAAERIAKEILELVKKS